MAVHIQASIREGSAVEMVPGNSRLLAVRGLRRPRPLAEYACMLMWTCVKIFYCLIL